jgi:hypothetical protein
MEVTPEGGAVGGQTVRSKQIVIRAKLEKTPAKRAHGVEINLFESAK